MAMRRAGENPAADLRREALITAGYRVAVDSGLANLRTRDVAAVAGINVATLHYYFSTKNDLIRAVVEHVIADQIASPLVDNGPTDEVAWLRSMLEGLRRQADQEPGRFRLLDELIWTARTD